MANTKIKAYKFVSPASGRAMGGAVASARVTTMAINRLGGTITSIANCTKDIERIAAASQKLEDQQEILERRRLRRERDQAAEEAAEVDKMEKGLDGKKAAKKKPDNKTKKGIRGALGWLEQFLGPLSALFKKLFAIGVIKSTLEYIGDPQKMEELKLFLHKVNVVFTKLYNFSSGLVNWGLDGFAKLSDPDGDFGQKITGLGQLITGIIGLKYLMNPFSLIADIMGLMDWFTNQLPGGPGGGPKPDLPNPKTIADKFGDAAAKQYKALLKKNKNGAKVFLNSLENGKSLRGALRDANKAIAKIEAAKPKKKGPLGQLSDWFNKGKTKAGEILGTTKTKTGNLLTNIGEKVTGQLSKWNQSRKGVGNWFNKGKDWLFETGSKKIQQGVEIGQAVWQKTQRALAERVKGIGNAINGTIDGAIGGFNKLKKGAQETIIKRILQPIQSLLDPLLSKVKGLGKGLLDKLAKIPGIKPILEFLKTKWGITSLGQVGKLASEIGPKMLVGIGGIVNLLFSYERFRSEDSIGGLIEGASGVFDLASLFTGGTGSVISSGLDAYMFVRDMMPFIMPNWDLQKQENKLVNALGLNTFKGQVDKLGAKLPPLGKIVEMFKGNVSDPLKENVQKGSEEVKKKGWWPFSAGGKLKLQEMIFGKIWKGVKKVASSVWSGVKKVGAAVGKITSNPIIGTALSFIPGAGPIMAGINAAVGLTQGNPLQAIMAGANHFFPGTMGKIGDFMDSKWGKLGTSLLTGDFKGAALQGLDMIPGDLGGFKTHLSSFINDPNPMNLLGNIAGELGMGGLFDAVTGMMQGDYTEAIQQIGSEIGIDPKVLGVAKNVSQNWSKEGGISQEYVMQQALDFIPVPIIVEKLNSIPTPVPINIDEGDVYGALSGLTSRM